MQKSCARKPSFEKTVFRPKKEVDTKRGLKTRPLLPTRPTFSEDAIVQQRRKFKELREQEGADGSAHPRRFGDGNAPASMGSSPEVAPL